VGKNIDDRLDNGVESTGVITTDGEYTGTGTIDVYYWID